MGRLGRPFEKGHAKLGGRRPGVQNKTTPEIRELARALTLENPEYVQNLQRRLLSGECAPAVEALVLAYGYGRPPERLEMDVRQRAYVVQLPAGARDPLALPSLAGGSDADEATDEPRPSIASPYGHVMEPGSARDEA